MMSAVTEEDKWNNQWLSKLRSINKIDAAVALVIAFGAAHTTSSSNEKSFWESAA
jgi:hypothetical protein